MVSSLRWAAVFVSALLVSGCALINTATPDHPERLTGWTAVPTDADPEFTEIALERCADPDAGEPRVIIQDQRGPDTAEFIVRSGDMDVDCRLMRFNDGVVRPAQLGMSSPTTPQRRLVLWRSGVETDGRGLVISSHVGSAGRDTARVVIELVGGDVIDATVANGRFLAFWPGDEPSAEVRALDDDGTVIRRIDGSDRERDRR